MGNFLSTTTDPRKINRDKCVENKLFPLINTNDVRSFLKSNGKVLSILKKHGIKTQNIDYDIFFWTSQNYCSENKSQFDINWTYSQCPFRKLILPKGYSFKADKNDSEIYYLCDPNNVRIFIIIVKIDNNESFAFSLIRKNYSTKALQTINRRPKNLKIISESEDHIHYEIRDFIEYLKPEHFYQNELSGMIYDNIEENHTKSEPLDIMEIDFDDHPEMSLTNSSQCSFINSSMETTLSSSMETILSSSIESLMSSIGDLGLDFVSSIIRNKDKKPKINSTKKDMIDLIAKNKLYDDDMDNIHIMNELIYDL
ncbi:hypothetical protein QLL95_gp0130 [Cotonvirus japonicus]|uniref:Uncharacterized protein n=1 Tax=Cotonvirus japonicus TaxID=2811091 RepID=A0ABM7NR34_9VIRU|nr:hypothetical protein QLL95_gp0130 [Cotonvirus japonicus]BCS82619.1 hypothetical protein [Cotonvirus japonicus]